MGTSRWFVGSSKSSNLDGCNAMQTMANRAFSPPDRLSIFVSSLFSLKRNFFIVSRRSFRDSIISLDSCTSSRGVFFGGRRSAWCCPKNCVSRGGAGFTFPPPEGCSVPINNRKSVDFPIPFLPTMPIFSPYLTERFASWKSSSATPV
mmetsp:Transcript_4966/g.8853  ORF Transcript_4966/g.8853 Transcript_4966/m.8853 type:complete len:148 (+) Transcript_4966:490-933(+)